MIDPDTRVGIEHQLFAAEPGFTADYWISIARQLFAESNYWRGKTDALLAAIIKHPDSALILADALGVVENGGAIMADAMGERE